MVHLTKFINAPYSTIAIKKLFNTSNYVLKESQIILTPPWYAGVKRRSDGSILLKTSVSGTYYFHFISNFNKGNLINNLHFYTSSFVVIAAPYTGNIQKRSSSSSAAVDSSKSTIVPDFSSYKKYSGPNTNR